MPIFQFTSPDGKNYSVNGPDGSTPEQAFQILQSQIGSGSAPTAPPPDKYQQAAIDEAKSLDASGAPRETGYTRRLVHGATLGADSTIMAGLETPLEMIKHGTMSPAEGYDYAKAREDQEMGDARKNTGLLGDAAEMLGGAATAGNVTGGVGGLARDAAGQIASAPARAVSFGAGLAPDAGLAARTAASAGDAAAIGGISGATEGNGLGERLENAVKGAGTGLAIGGALPVAATVAKGLAAAPAGWLKALTNPEGYADSQVARVVHESGQTPQQLGDRVAAANAEGTPLTLADALGKPGQDMLSTVTRSPGQGSTDAAAALNSRQAGQGRRVVNALTEGFDSPQTPDALRGAMMDARDTAADASYGAVRDDAEPVNVTNVLDHIDQHLEPFGVPQDTEAEDGITGSMRKYRRMLGANSTNLDGSAAGGLNDFRVAQQVRGDLSDEIQRSVRAGDNNKARVLGGVLRRLDNSLEDASPGFKQANRDFRRASQNIDAIDQGRDASMRGRTEDILPQFNALEPAGQRAFRTGYVDPLIQDARGAGPGANKAAPLLNDAFRDESAAMAPRGQVVNGRVVPGMNVDVAGPRMARRIADENTMFETRNRALGGSKTADNLNNDAAMAVDPHLIGNVLSSNWHGAIRNVLSAGHTVMTGNTPAVRAAVGRILLDRGVNPQNLQNAIGQTVARIQFMQQLARGVGRAGSGALAVARPGQSN